MRSSFYPRMVNGPFDDPVLYVPFLHRKRAFLFDLGDLSALPPRDLLKVSHGFVSHTHIDHFIGFDRLLRLMLGREKTLRLYGPNGFLANAEGKLAGYSWNLVQNYQRHLILDLAEIRGEQILRQRYRCGRRFRPGSDPVAESFSGQVLSEPGLTVTAAILDHGIPCLGFSLEETFHVNIIKDQVQALGLEVGPWLAELKQALYAKAPAETIVNAKTTVGSDRETPMELGFLAERIVRISPGQKICYITDAAYTPENVSKMVALARDADQLYIEASFSEVDRRLAEQKRHLTARQAGIVAAKARVKRLTVFHFSPRYDGSGSALQEEARDAFEQHRSVSPHREST